MQASVWSEPGSVPAPRSFPRALTLSRERPCRVGTGVFVTQESDIKDTAAGPSAKEGRSHSQFQGSASLQVPQLIRVNRAREP